MKNYLKLGIIIFTFFLISCGGGSTSLNYMADKESPTATESKDYSSSDASGVDSYSDREDMKKEEAPVDVPGETEKNQQKKNIGLLTAGEWNDVENLDFWQNLMENQQWSAMQGLWHFYMTNTIPVNVKDQSGNPLNNVKVILEDIQGAIVWQARTDIFGNAELFSDIFGEKHEHLKIRIESEKGEKSELDKVITNKVNQLTLNSTNQTLNDLDIMFVVDATGSMGDELEFLKTDLNSILSKVKSKTPELNPRVGMVFYRDMDDEYLVKDYDFETDIAKILNNLNPQTAGGGGDFEEAVQKGLEHALNGKSWSNNAKTKLMFLILDAPPHRNNDDIASIQRSLKKAAELGIKIIPITASGIDKNTEFLMRFMSISTNGTYVFLTDDSGIGNSHLVPTTGKYEVEFLNDLIIRLIMKYTGNPGIS